MTSTLNRLLALTLTLTLISCEQGLGSVEATPGDNDGWRAVDGWPALPEGVTLGEVTGGGVDSQGHVFIFHRASAAWGNETVIEEPTIFELDGESGELLNAWGEGRFLVPRGLSVDAEDNIWVTDVGTDAVYKFSHSGELLLQIGGSS